MANKIKITIREAVESDMDQVHQMLCDLISFQKFPYPAMDRSMLVKDSGLTPAQPHPYFHILVAEKADHQLAGYALWYFTYKTNTGKYVYLEDIFVKEEFRGSGVGHRLMKRLSDICVQHQAVGIRLQCLSWSSATKFYERCGAVWNGNQTNDWLEYEMVGYAVHRLHELTYD